MKKTRKKEKTVFGRNVSEIRKTLGLSGHALAEKAGIPYPTLRDIEAGYNAGRESTKAAIVKALGVPMADMYRDPSPIRKVPPMLEFPNAAALLTKFGALSPAHRDLVLAIVFEDPGRAAHLTEADLPVWLPRHSVERLK